MSGLKRSDRPPARKRQIFFVSSHCVCVRGAYEVIDGTEQNQPGFFPLLTEQNKMNPSRLVGSYPKVNFTIDLDLSKHVKSLIPVLKISESEIHLGNSLRLRNSFSTKKLSVFFSPSKPNERNLRGEKGKKVK